MSYTPHYPWIPFRTAEVTVADSTLDGTTANNTLWDLTKKDFHQLGDNDTVVELFFAGEAANNDTAAAKVYLQAINGPAHKICDVTIRAGSSYFKGIKPGAAQTVVDSTTYLVADTVILDASNDYFFTDVYDQSLGGVSVLTFNARGHDKIWVEFKSIAGVNQFTRITPYGRSW